MTRTWMSRPAALVLAAFAAVLLGAPPVLATEPALELTLQAPTSIDGVTPYDLTLTVVNRGQAACHVSSSITAVAVTSVTLDGASVKPSLDGPGLVLAGAPSPDASRVELPPGGSLVIPMAHDRASVSTWSVLPDSPASMVAERWPVATRGTYQITAGLVPLSVGDCALPATATARVAVAPATGGLPVIPIAIVVILVLVGLAVLAIRGRRSGRAARAAVIVLALIAGEGIAPRPAAAQIFYNLNAGDSSAADACGRVFSASGGDPAGVYASAVASSHTITIDASSTSFAVVRHVSGSTPVPPGTGSDSTVYWRPGLNLSAGGIAPDDCANLYEGLAVAVDIANGTFDSRRTCGGLGYEDVRATLADNLYRASYGLPTYSRINGQPLPASLDACPPPKKPTRKAPMQITCRTASCAYVGGDPHFETFDGLRYDLQAAGEFVLARSADGAMEIQVREQAVPGSTAVAAVTAVAAGIGGSHVMLRPVFDADAAGTRLAMTVDGAPQAGSGPQGIATAGSIEASAAGDQVALRWTDGSAALVSVIPGTQAIRVDVRPGGSSAGSLAGLLGDGDGTQESDLALADGSTLEQPASFADLNGRFADSWRVTDETSLFTYEPGTSTATFTDRAFPSTDPAPAVADQLASAREICAALGVDPSAEADLADCAFDLASTGQASFASAAIEHSLEPADDAVDIGAGPSGSPAPSSVPETVDRGPMGAGDTVGGTFAEPAERDVYDLHADAGTVAFLTAGGDCSPLAGGSPPTWYLARAADPDVPITATLPFCVDLGRYAFPGAGDFVLVIDANGYTVPYSFTWAAVASASDAPIALGADVHGTLATAGQRDTYLFTTTDTADIQLVSPNGCDDGFVFKVAQGDSTTSVGTLCGTSQPIHLGGGGTWQIVISAPDVTGDYSFRIQPSQG